MKWNLIRKQLQSNNNFIKVIVICMLFFSLTAATQSLRSDVPNHGNYWTDMSVLLHAKNFQECGILSLKFISTWDQGCLIGLPLPKNTSFTSIHPTFAAIVLAILMKTGLKIQLIRLIMLFLSTTTIVGIYLLVSEWFDNKKLGLFTAFSFATLPFFRLLSDNFTIPYDITYRVWMFFLITKYSLSLGNETRIKWALFCFIGSLLNGLFFSVEIIPSILTFATLAPLVTMAKKGSISIKKVSFLPILVGTGYLVGGGVRLVQLYWALGSIDLLEQLVIGRASHRLSSPFIQDSTPVVSYIFWLAYRMVRLAPFHVLLTFASVLIIGVTTSKKLRGIKEKSKSNALNFHWGVIPILLSENIWYIFFRQHSYEHDHTILQIAISIALLSGVFIFFIEKVIKNKKWSKYIRSATLAILLFQVTFLPVLRPLGYNVQTYFDTSFLDRQVKLLKPLFQETEVINLAEAPSFPPYYLIQNIKDLPNKPILTWRTSDELVNKEYLLLANPNSQVFNELIDKMGLVGLTRHYAVFDPLTSETILNLIFGGYGQWSNEIEENWEGNIGLLGFWLDNQPRFFCPTNESPKSNWKGNIEWLMYIPPNIQIPLEQTSGWLEIKIKDCEGVFTEKIYTIKQEDLSSGEVIHRLVSDQQSYDKGIIISLECGGSLNCMNVQVYMAPILIKDSNKLN